MFEIHETVAIDKPCEEVRGLVKRIVRREIAANVANPRGVLEVGLVVAELREAAVSP